MCSNRQIFRCRRQNCRLPAHFDWAATRQQSGESQGHQHVYKMHGHHVIPVIPRETPLSNVPLYIAYKGLALGILLSSLTIQHNFPFQYPMQHQPYLHFRHHHSHHTYQGFYQQQTNNQSLHTLSGCKQHLTHPPLFNLTSPPFPHATLSGIHTLCKYYK